MSFDVWGRGPWVVHALMLIANVAIATSFTVGAAITAGLDPKMLTLIRFALAALLFAPFIAWRYGLTFPPWKSFAGYATISLCLVFFFWSMFEALRHTTSLNTGALFTLVPGFSAIYAAVLLRERLGTRRLIALGFGFFGAFWVIFRGDPGRLLSLDFNRGDLIFLFGCLAMGLYMPLVGRFHRGEPAPVMTFWTLVTGTGWLLIINNAAVWRTDWGQVDTAVFGGIVYLAVFSTLMTFFIYQYVTLRIGPTRAAAYYYLNPALVVGVEFILGKGLPTLMTMPGVAIVFLATVVLQLGGSTKAVPGRRG